MTEGFKDYEKIGMWLEGSLSSSESNSMQQMYDSDSSFAAKVDEYKDLVTGINLSGEKSTREKLNEVQSKLESEGFFEESTEPASNAPRKTNSVKWIGLALLAAALMAVLTLIMKEESEPKVETPVEQIHFASNTTHPPVSLNYSLDRAEAFGLADDNKSEKEVLAKILQKIERKEFKAAEKELTQFMKVSGNNDPVLKLQLAYTKLQNGKYDQSISLLSPLAADDAFRFEEEAKWYLGLAMVNSPNKKNQSNALDILSAIAQNRNSEYSTKAQQILKSITIEK